MMVGGLPAIGVSNNYDRGEILVSHINNKDLSDMEY
jgi:hypothetical protein